MSRPEKNVERFGKYKMIQQWCGDGYQPIETIVEYMGKQISHDTKPFWMTLEEKKKYMKQRGFVENTLFDE